MTFWYIIWSADPFASKLGLMARHHTVDCFVKLLDYSVVVKFKVTEKVQNFSECTSECYLLCWTFCNQTWYGDETSWAKISCKKIGFPSWSSGSQWRLIWWNMTVSTISAGIFCPAGEKTHLLSHSLSLSFSLSLPPPLSLSQGVAGYFAGAIRAMYSSLLF